jgi:hypothetical protein
MTTLQDPESLAQFVEAEADAGHKEGGALLPRSRSDHHHHRSHGGGPEVPSCTDDPPTLELPPADEEALFKVHLEEAQHFAAPRLELRDVEVAPLAADGVELDTLQFMQEELARLAHAFEAATEELADEAHPLEQESGPELTSVLDEIADVSGCGADDLVASQFVDLAVPDEEPEILESVPPVEEPISSDDLNDLLTEALGPVEPVVKPAARVAPAGWAAALEPPKKKVASRRVVLPAPQKLSTPAALDTASKGPTAPKWAQPEAVIVVHPPKAGMLAKLRRRAAARWA